MFDQETIKLIDVLKKHGIRVEYNINKGGSYSLDKESENYQMAKDLLDLLEQYGKYQYLSGRIDVERTVDSYGELLQRDWNIRAKIVNNR